VLGQNSVDRRQTEAGALAFRLRREEGLKEAVTNGIGNAFARIRHADENIIPGGNSLILPYFSNGKTDVLRRYCKISSCRHGIRGIFHKVETGLKNLGGVGLDRIQVISNIKGHVYVFPNCAAEHVVQAGDCRTDVNNPHLKNLFPSEGQ